MNFKKISAFLTSLAIMTVIGITLVSAQGTNPGDGGAPNPGDGGASNPRITVRLDNPFRGDGDIFSILRSIIDNVLLPIGGVLAVMGFIWSGFLYVMAQGKPGDIAKAHTAFKYTAIGTIILFGSRAIAEVIKNTIQQLR